MPKIKPKHSSEVISPASVKCDFSANSYVVYIPDEPNKPQPWIPSKRAKAKAISRKDQNQSKSRGAKN